MMIKAHNREHLRKLIQQQIQLHGNGCDLNYIDISQVTSLNELFLDSSFNGNISQWDTGNVTTMKNMFGYSLFNGDISKWNTSHVKDMCGMFSHSQFSNDISQWDVKHRIKLRFFYLSTS